jgi:hypothetical protein
VDNFAVSEKPPNVPLKEALFDEGRQIGTHLSQLIFPFLCIDTSKGNNDHISLRLLIIKLNYFTPLAKSLSCACAFSTSGPSFEKKLEYFVVLSTHLSLHPGNSSYSQCARGPAVPDRSAKSFAHGGPLQQRATCDAEAPKPPSFFLFVSYIIHFLCIDGGRAEIVARSPPQAHTPTAAAHLTSYNWRFTRHYYDARPVAVALARGRTTIQNPKKNKNKKETRAGPDSLSRKSSCRISRTD